MCAYIIWGSVVKRKEYKLRKRKNLEKTEDVISNGMPLHKQSGEIVLPDGNIIDIDDPSIEIVKANSSESSKKRYVIGTVIALVIIYVFGVIFFATHYYPRTTLGNKGCSLRSKVGVKQQVMNTTMNVEYSLIGRENEEFDFNSNDVQMNYSLDETLLSTEADYIGALQWPKYIIIGNPLPFPIIVEYDEKQMESYLSSQELFDESKHIQPVNAYIGKYSSDENRYELVEDEKGNVLDIAKTLSVIRNKTDELSLGDRQLVINLDESDCYKHAAIESDNIRLQNAWTTANRCMSSVLDYTWNETPVKIDKNLIVDWLSFEDEDLVINKDEIKRFVATKAYENDTFGQTMQFVCNDGVIRPIKRGGYGWKTDVEATTKDLISAILVGTQDSKEPIYSCTGYVHGLNDVGGSYVEVDMTTQHLWVYMDNAIVFETDVVTGNVSNGNYTPAGIFGITYKERDATLRGETYESHVKYWMPFNGNIGMHDATWRNAFGGQLYLYGGSHGCVNLPLSSAATIYDYVCENFPVVCYYEDGAIPIAPIITPEMLAAAQTESEDNLGQSTDSNDED